MIAESAFAWLHCFLVSQGAVLLGLQSVVAAGVKDYTVSAEQGRPCSLAPCFAGSYLGAC